MARSLRRSGPARLNHTVLVLLVFVIALGGCVTSEGSTSAGASRGAPPPLHATLGLLAPLTGDAAELGASQHEFARLAVAHFNARMGTEVALAVADTQHSPAHAARAAEQLAADDTVLAVVGLGGSAETLAALPMLAASDLALVASAATADELTQRGYGTVFRVALPDELIIQSTAGLTANLLGARSAWLVDDGQEAGAQITVRAARELEAWGVAVTRASLPAEQAGDDALVARMAIDAHEVVVLTGKDGTRLGRFARALHEAGVDTTLIGAAPLLSPAFLAAAGDAAEGALAIAGAPDIHLNPGAATIIAEYRARRGDLITPAGPTAYLATQLVLEAIYRAHLTGRLEREQVTAELRATVQDYSILEQPIRFTPQGELVEPRVFVYQIADGQPIQVQ